MRKYMIAGNWKMNGSLASVKELLTDVQAGASELSSIDWVVFPSFPFLPETERLLTGSNVHWGAQNVSDKPSGAYTGEVSVAMLHEFGCKYVLIGHSERRALYGEDDVVVAAKYVEATDGGLTPIVCVGETLYEREHGQTDQVIRRQLDAVLQLDNGIDRLSKAIIAYEPVWAIGTGVTASPEQAQDVHAKIRAQIAEHDVDVAEKMQILYGGSVKPANARALFAMSDIDGGLIGGASLKANDFIEIGKACIN